VTAPACIYGPATCAWRCFCGHSTPLRDENGEPKREGNHLVYGPPCGAPAEHTRLGHPTDKCERHHQAARQRAHEDAEKRAALGGQSSARPALRRGAP
jgi:hypothetical protein